jgi:hypothetical protein
LSLRERRAAGAVVQGVEVVESAYALESCGPMNRLPFACRGSRCGVQCRAVENVVVISVMFLLLINFYFNFNTVFMVAVVLRVVLVMVLMDLLEVIGVPPCGGRRERRT